MTSIKKGSKTMHFGRLSIAKARNRYRARQKRKKAIKR